jgi:uncharacterized protein YbbC (DUF1343 family)/CubicO group peptidase (beta-lactamase class C family)
MRVLCLAAFAATALAAQMFPGSQAIDEAIAQAIREDKLPGAVCIVGHRGRIVHRKAYGNRALYPAREAMTVDTIFDIASLTKVAATTPALMQLYEQGKFRLDERVTKYIPEFQNGRSAITLRQLFTHFSGLKPDVVLDPPWQGYDTGIRLACTTPPADPPGAKFVYSDINFELLGDLVRRLSGEPLADYARRHIFQPLGMAQTMFQPPASLMPRIAPTEREPKDGRPLRGVVHDPTARYMGGVAGHAGVFSTADDLARYAQMMLNGGELDGARLFTAATVREFTTPQSPAGQAVLRGLGWDIDSPYSRSRGELFPVGSYGHTGFTGTSLWIDPASQTYVILLANSVHPQPRPALSALRSAVATAAAAGVGINAVKTALDALEEKRFDVFRGKRIGLITNQTGVDRLGRRNVDVMKAAGVNVAALFSPEHGFGGVEDREGIQDAVDPATGIRIHSLYGATLRPTPAMLKGLDALVFDIADVGARFYTYPATMAYAMEAAAKAGLPFYVLDRPNPITGGHMEGPPLDAARVSFNGYLPGLPVRHGMTMGELARLFNDRGKIGAALTVIPVEGWRRADWFDATSQPWVNPSPNMRNLNAAALYPGLCLLESAPGFSEGRGTDAPFEQIGAAFIRGGELADYLNSRAIPGVRARATAFTPAESVSKGVRIEGVRFEITDRDQLDSTRLGLELAAALQKLHPGKMDFAACARLIGSDDVVRRLTAGEDPRLIVETFRDSLQAFEKLRQQYLLYP